MQLAERIDRFDARAVEVFVRVLGVALVADVATELYAGVWRVHAGELYPWRHLGLLPLYPPGVLALEWALRASAGVALAVAAHRVHLLRRAVRVVAPVLFVALLERYSNHGVLLFLVALFLSMAPPDVRAPSFDAAPHPALGLVRAQLVIVYVFSALNKAVHGFGRGESLANLAAHTPLGSVALSASGARALSWGVMALELAVPLVLLRWPRAGLVLVVVVHVAFAALVPGVVSFGITMIALACLFQRAPRSRGSSD